MFIILLCLFFLAFNFDLLSTSQEISWEDNPRNELFCVKRDIKL